MVEMTVATPMTMPKSVSVLRSRWPQNVPSASRKLSETTCIQSVNRPARCVVRAMSLRFLSRSSLSRDGQGIPYRCRCLGPRHDRVPQTLPSSVAALQRTDPMQPPTRQLERHPGTRPFAGSTAIQDQVPVMGDFAMAARKFRWRDVERTGESVRVLQQLSPVA